MRLLKICAVLASLLGTVSAAAAGGQAVVPANRILTAIDGSALVTLKGNTHPAANSRNDRGRVSPALPMSDLILVLSRSPEQQAAFSRFIASQYEPGSPNFHHWLKPAEVGADFGPSQTDIALIETWLTREGFAVNQLSPDHMSIRFGGTAAQVESAFHTEIHNLEVKGVGHIGNMSDPQIPAAMATAVVGIKSLHNFFPRPLHRTGARVSRDAATGKWLRPAHAKGATAASDKTAVSTRTGARPQFGINDTTDGYVEEDVTPYDFATIYNVLPLWNASTPIDGTGQTIAIAGTSAIVESDIDTFRSTFGLPAYTSATLPTVVSGNSSPLTVCPDSAGACTIDDLIENTLDVEWSGGVAKGANIVLVASYPTSDSDDNLYDSESYIVTNQLASVMSVSYGLCELGNGTAGNVEYYNLWQTAATEGIAVFVAAGDGGAAECDDGGDSAGNPYSAQFGLSVNGLASTPYNTAVGGTDFNWCNPGSTTECTPAPYWNTTNASNGSSAAGYIPEVPWNDTCADPLSLGLFQNIATSNGLTSPTTVEGGCNFVYNNWSAIESSTGSDIAYYVDSVGGGGGASGCVSNNGEDVTSCATTTTTTGTANGSITLVADGWPKPSWQANVTGIPTDGVRDLPDISFFASDGFLSYSAYLICVSEVADCTYTTDTEPFSQEVGGTSVSSPAMAGVMAMINQHAGEAQGSPNTELYSLAAKQTYSSCSAETGKITNSCYFNDVDMYTNAVPCDYGADEGDPAESGIVSPNCTVSTKGDTIGLLTGNIAAVGYDLATGLGSLNVANVVQAWPVSTAVAKATVTVTPASATVGAGTALTIAVTVAASTSGGATPTGKVTLIGGQYASGAQTLASGAYSFTIPADSLAAGTDVFTVSYAGDATYAAITGTATVTVTADAGSSAATVTVTPASTSIAASSSLSVAVAVASGTGGATPTGTVTLTGGGYTSTPETLASGAFTFTIPASTLTAGADTLTATYSGDTTYASATGTASITVTSSTSTGTFTLSAGAATADSPGTSSSSIVTATTTDNYTGTVAMTCALTGSPSGAVDLPACTLSPTSVALSSSATTGTVTATITTTAATTTTSQLTEPRRPVSAKPGFGGKWAGGGAVLALMALFGIPAKRRSWRNIAGMLLLVATFAGLAACGDFWEAPGGNAANGTTTGTYTFTVTGAGSPAVSAAETTTFTMVVN